MIAHKITLKRRLQLCITTIKQLQGQILYCLSIEYGGSVSDLKDLRKIAMASFMQSLKFQGERPVMDSNFLRR